jgi:hypothetical protein
MKLIINTGLAFGLVFALSSCATQSGSSSSVPMYYAAPEPSSLSLAPGEAAPPSIEVGTADAGWPRILTNGPTTNIIYQPQIDSWDGHALEARSAVGVQSLGHAWPIYGVITFKATTLVDKTTRTATLEDIQVTRADFPSAPDKATNYLQDIRAGLPKQVETLSLDRLEASLAVAPLPPQAKAQPLNNTPPNIIFTSKPTILVSIDGPPVYRPVKGTDLQRVMNTRVLLLKDGTGRYYLHVLDGYLEAPRLEGQWTVTKQVPSGVAEAEKEARDSQEADLLEGQPDPKTNQTPSLATSTPPKIEVATKPTELVTFNGEPDFTPVAGTQLLYAANTTGNVFKRLDDQQTYVLLSGRWFRAPTLSGPWQYVPGSQLPADFAQIPDSSPKENVKASVPGTPQAAEALIANSIPQSTKVPRTAQIQTPRFDGGPQIKPIEGTHMNYVVNSDTPIIEVDSHAWYACQDGVWYAGNSPGGPWNVAASVPPEIYTIPPSSPLHYVTYVQVYNSTPDTVYEGYTPGYLGTEVSPDGTVVYGTGYDYSPWIGSVWYGPPVTWGLGYGDCWTPWWGWAFGCGFGWGWGGGFYGGWPCVPPLAWWGPYRHWPREGLGRYGGWGHDGWRNTAGNLYGGRWGHPGGAFNPAARNEWSGRGFGRSYNSRTGALAAGERAQVRNVYNPARIAPGRSGFMGNNALATRNGSVFLNRGSGSLGSWHSMTPSGGRLAPSSITSNLGREQTARSIGAQRSYSFQSGRAYSGSSFHGSYGGSSGVWSGGGIRSGSAFSGSGFRSGGGFRSSRSSSGGHSGGFSGGHSGGFGGGHGGGGFGGGGHGGGGGHR